MSGTLAGPWDMAMEQGALWVRYAVVQDENLTGSDIRIRVRYHGATTNIMELTVGSGITLDYGVHDVGDEAVTGTLITMTRTAVQTAALQKTNTARYSIWDEDTGEHYLTGRFEIEETVLT